VFLLPVACEIKFSIWQLHQHPCECRCAASNAIASALSGDSSPRLRMSSFDSILILPRESMPHLIEPSWSNRSPQMPAELLQPTGAAVSSRACQASAALNADACSGERSTSRSAA
jgi:hypothetical protein